MPISVQDYPTHALFDSDEYKYPNIETTKQDNLAYSIAKSSEGFHLKSLLDETVHIYEPLDCNVLVIEGGKFVIHAPCNVRLMQVDATSIEFRDTVTSIHVRLKAHSAAFYAMITAEMLQAEIEEEFYLDDAGVMMIEVFDLRAIAANFLGTLKISKVASIDVNQIELGGQAEWQGLTVLKAHRLICYEGSQFSITHSHLKYTSILNVDQQVVLQEHSTLHLSGLENKYVVLKTNELTQQGNLECHTAIVDSDNIVIVANAKLTATFSEVHGKQAVVYGEMTLQNSLLNVDDYLQSQNSKAEWHSSNVQSKSYLKVDGELKVIKTNCFSDNFVLRAKTKLEEANIQATTLKLQATQIDSSNSQFICNQLLLDATNEGKQEHYKLTLQADSLETRGKVLIKNSQLNLIGQGILTNVGTLQLTDSQVACKGQISNAKEANLQITYSAAFSVVRENTFEPNLSSNYISNQGNILIVKAKIAINSISHTGQSFILDEAMCYVETGLIIDNNAQLTLTNKSILLGCKDAIVAVKSRIEIKGESKVEAKFFYSLPDAKIEITNAQLALERVGLLGESHLTKSVLQSRSASVIGKLHTDDSHLVIDGIDVNGEWLKKKTQLIAKANVILGGHAQISSIDSIIKTKKLEIQAKIKLEGTTQWKAESITTQHESIVNGSALKVETSIWNHAGKIELDKELHAKGAQLLNSGKISAVGSANLGFNALVNAGHLNATQLNITTAAYMNTGRICGHNVKINSLVNVNLGLTQAFNLQVNALHHSNLGLYIPDLTHPDEWLTYSSIQSAGKIIATNLLPNLSPYIQLVFSAPSFLKTAQAGWKARGNFTKDKLSQFYLHEYVEHALNISQFASSGIQVYNSLQTVYTNSHWKSLSIDLFPKSISFAEIGAAAIKAIAPKTTTQLIFDVNAGANFSWNINESAFYSLNSGSKYAFDSYTLDAYQIIDLGQSNSLFGATRLKALSILTKGAHHSDLDSVHLQADVVAIAESEHKDHQDFDIKSQSLQIAGDHVFRRTNIKTEHLQLGIASEQKHQISFTQGSVITTEAAEFHQDLHLSGATMLADEVKHETKIHLSNKAKLAVKSEHLINGEGILIADEKSRLSNKVLILKDHASYQSDDSTTQSNFVQTYDAGHIQISNKSKLKTDELKTAGLYESHQSLTVADHVAVLAGGALQLQDSSGLKMNVIATDGKFEAKQSQIEVEKIHVEQHGAFELNQSVLQAKEIHSDGKTSLTTMLANIQTKVVLGAQTEFTMDNAILKTELLEDSSVIKVAGTSQLDVGHYNHHGRLQVKDGADATQSKLIVNAKTASLKGSSKLANATFAIETFKDAAALAMGQGELSQYAVSDSLHVKANEILHLSGYYQRQCDLNVEAPAIEPAAQFVGDYSLELNATQGGLLLDHLISVTKFKGKAKRDINIKGGVNSQKELILHTDGKIDNKGTLLASNAMLKGSSIDNYGSIEGSDKVLMHATFGDIHNHAGSILGVNYVQLQAAGNVINQTVSELVPRFVHSRFRKKPIALSDNYSSRKYRAGQIWGGAGTLQTEGVGLKIIAKGKYINDGADIVSDGHNVIIADQGLEFNAQTHTYISEHKKSSTLFSSSESWKTATQVQQAKTVSRQGKTILQSAHGGLDSKGGQFSSAQGTQADIEKKVNLFSVITQDKEFSKSKFLFLGSSEDKIIEAAKPTLIIDQGQTIIRSRTEDVNGIGTIILGEEVYIKGKNVNLVQDVLTQQIDIQQQSLGLSILGMNAFETAKNDGNAWDMIASEDHTLGSVNNLMKSKGTTGNVTAAANLGLDVFNTAGQVATAFNQGNVAGAAMQRYGLGSADSFKPSASVSVSNTHTQTKRQTLGDGAIYAKNLTIVADEKINIKGYSLNASGDASLEAKEINMLSLELESSMDSHTEKVSVGLTATGDITNVGLGLSQSSSRSKQHAHSNLNVGGNLHLKADNMKMRGANIEANSITGHVGKLELESVQDEMFSEFQSVDANTSGMVSIQSQTHESKEVRQVTGIHIKSAVNTPEKAFTVGQLQKKGAKFNSDVLVNDFTQSITTESIHDYSKTQGIGFSGNPSLLSDKSPAQPSLPAFSVNFQHENKHNLLHSNGDREVLSDTQVQFTANVPIVDMDRASETWGQIKEASNTIFSSQDQPITETNNSNYVLGSFNLEDAMAQESSAILPATHVRPTLEHAQVELEKKEDIVEEEITTKNEHKKSEVVGLDPNLAKMIDQMAECGMVPFNFVTVMEALAASATVVGTIPAAILATYSMDEFAANLATCLTGIKHDTYLTQLMKDTMPTIEREFSMMKDAYSLLYAKSGFMDSTKHTLELLSHKFKTPINSAPTSTFDNKSHQAKNSHSASPQTSKTHKSESSNDPKPKIAPVVVPKHPVTKNTVVDSPASTSPHKVIIKPLSDASRTTQSKELSSNKLQTSNNLAPTSPRDNKPHQTKNSVTAAPQINKTQKSESSNYHKPENAPVVVTKHPVTKNTVVDSPALTSPHKVIIKPLSDASRTTQSKELLSHKFETSINLAPTAPQINKIHKPEGSIHHQLKNAPMVTTKPPVAKNSVEVIVKPVIIKPLHETSVLPNGKVIIKPVIVKPLSVTPLSFHNKHNRNNKNHHTSKNDKTVVKPWPMMSSTPSQTKTPNPPRTSHVKSNNALLVIPQPVVAPGSQPTSSASFGDYKFFKNIPTDVWKGHKQQSENKFFSDSEHSRLNHAVPKKPQSFELVNPENALAMTAEHRAMRNAHFLQASDYSNPGSLPEDLAVTFAGHRYKSYILNEPVILARAGTYPNKLGRFFSFESPKSELQARIDKAILPAWPSGDPSPLDTTHWIEFPARTTIHVGQVAGQGNGFWGHTQQVVIEQPWNITNRKHLYSFPLKKEKQYQKFKR